MSENQTSLKPTDAKQESGEGLSSSALFAALNSLGFEECEEGGDCEKCNKESGKLYFGNPDYWDCREGDTWCAQCVVDFHEANERDYAAAMSSSVND